MSRASLLAVGALGLAFFLGGCSCENEEEQKPAQSQSPTPSVSPPSKVHHGPIRRPLLESATLCSLDKRGLVLDLGSKNAGARRLFHLKEEAPAQFTSRLSESFRRLDQMETDFVFWSREELSEFEFQGQIHGLSSERMAIYVDGKRLGAAKLETGVTRTVRISAREMKLAAGRHTLRIALSRPRSGPPSAEVSWVRLGPPRGKKTDQPATESQSFAEVTIDEQRHASFILQPGSRLRCPLWLPPHTVLTTKAGLWGQGEGEFEVTVHRPDGTAQVVGAEKRDDEAPRSWKDLRVDLSPFANELVELEFAAHGRSTDARIAFANPSLESKSDETATSPGAKRAIVLVLSGLSRRHAPPQAGENGLPILNQLAQEGASFPHYRSTTTSETGFTASLLTGAPPWRHGLADTQLRLPSDLPTLASAIEAAGGRSSFFTGVPPSFEDFGFDRGFESFVSIPPQKDEAATAPLTQAKKWLQESLLHEGPVLSIIELRGGHPPFDISKDFAMKLPPAEYGGNLTPRRAALQLENVRKRRSRNRNLLEEDWIRFESMQKAALLRQNNAIGELIAWLRLQEAFDDTLLVVVGDVGAGERPEVPFDPDAPLEESYLSVPLIIKFPKAHRAGQHVKGYFAPRDLSYTVAKSLGIDFDPHAQNVNLASSAATGQARLRPHIAYRDGEYSLRVGSSLLKGQDGSAPQLCKPEIDPTCQIDRSAEHLIESRALWLTTWTSLAPSLAQPREGQQKREENEELENALTVWGISP